MATEMKNETSEKLETLYGREAHVPARVRTWRPTAGGILEIITGYINIVFGVAMIGGVVFLPASLTGLVGVGFGLGIASIVLGILSAIGGSLALQRRSWPWTLVGSITALFPSIAVPTGVLALIFNTLGKDEF